MPTNTRRRLAILFFVPLAFSLVFFFVNLAAEHTDTGLLEIQNLSSSVAQLRALANDAEAGEHGFLLTGDERISVSVTASERIAKRSDPLLPKERR